MNKKIRDFYGDEFVDFKIKHIKELLSDLDVLEEVSLNENEFNSLALSKSWISNYKKELYFLEKNSDKVEYDNFIKSLLK